MITINGKDWEPKFVHSTMKAIVLDMTGEDNLTEFMREIANPTDVGRVADIAISCAFHTCKHLEGFPKDKAEFADSIVTMEPVYDATNQFVEYCVAFHGIKPVGSEKQGKTAAK